VIRYCFCALVTRCCSVELHLSSDLMFHSVDQVMLFHGEEDGRQMLETWGFWRLLGKHSENGARLLSYELLVWVG
jgi:hypothetical protein